MTAHAPPVIDLRSDTVTQPTAGMRHAIANAEVGDDVLSGDPTTRRLEIVVAERLGKERALFFPTGTMANQTAIWLLTKPGTELLADEQSHIVEWEMAGTAALAGVQVLPVRSARGAMRAADLQAAMRPASGSSAETSLVCVENTHNGAGGTVTSIDELRALRDVAQRASLPLHLDGARLWNAAVATGTSLDTFASCADTVMVSFSKGLGAPAGAILAGPDDVIGRAIRVRRRLGGGMRQSGILAAGALYGLEHHFDRLAEDHEAARSLANIINGAGGVSVVHPDTNIIMIDLPTPNGREMVARAKAQGVLISFWHDRRVRAVTHLNAPGELVADAAVRLRRAFEG